MRIVTLMAGAALLILPGCNSASSVLSTIPPAPAGQGTYSGTASVGDFLTITLDSASETITYNDLSNGDHGTLPFTVKSSDIYSISDPSGNLVTAYEYPNYGLVIEANKAGPNHDTMALITAVARAPISIADVANQTFNYMQFRTSQGGFEIGSAGIDSQGNITISSYWPFGAYYAGTPFHDGTFPALTIEADPSGYFLKVTDVAGSVTYLFSTTGEFVADRPDGTFMGFKKAASKTFDPAFSGSYKTNVYQKLGAASSQPNLETGTPGFDNGSLIIGTDGQVTFTNSQNQVLAQGTLVPVADVSEFYNGGILSLQDPCFGVFTFRITTATSQQDVFMSFGGQSVAFTSFKTALPQDRSQTYDYFYGVAVR